MYILFPTISVSIFSMADYKFVSVIKVYPFYNISTYDAKTFSLPLNGTVDWTNDLLIFVLLTNSVVVL